MTVERGILTFCTIALGVAAVAQPAFAQVLIDPGFENYAVSAGGFTRPSSGPWTFTNDAGVVEPISPNSSTGALNTWSATRAAFEGQQYACTYANADTIRQQVTFASSGIYRLSLEAFAPGGALTIPGVFANKPLVDGQFRFWFNNSEIGPIWTVPAGQDWTLYSTDINVANPGTYNVGMSNSLTDTFFINYDAFSVTTVPEPVTAPLLGVVLIFRRGRRSI